MNVTVSHIRSALQECYPPREAANLSRIVCCEMLGQSHIDYGQRYDFISKG
jgi:release factor glutamine methyltransferase